jgi:hypothetical protein
MLTTLISSQTRIKLLLKFFLNSSNTAHLRALESDFGESTNGIRLELNRLEEAGLLVSFHAGNKKQFRANAAHPLFKEIRNLVHNHLELDHIIEEVILRLGNLEKVYLTGAFAKGLDSQYIDLVFVGNIDESFLMRLVERAQALIHRKVCFKVYTPEAFLGSNVLNEPAYGAFLLWERGDKELEKVDVF